MFHWVGAYLQIGIRYACGMGGELPDESYCLQKLPRVVPREFFKSNGRCSQEACSCCVVFGMAMISKLAGDYTMGQLSRFPSHLLG